jgi:hypothetical protein
VRVCPSCECTMRLLRKFSVRTRCPTCGHASRDPNAVMGYYWKCDNCHAEISTDLNEDATVTVADIKAMAKALT